MFGVLGSLLFWAIYLLVSFFVGSVLLKHIAPLTWKTIKTGKRPGSTQFSGLKANPILMVLMFLVTYIFWPFLLLGIIIFFTVKLTVKHIIWPGLRKSVIATEGFIPDIDVKFNKKDKENGI